MIAEAEGPPEKESRPDERATQNVDDDDNSNYPDLPSSGDDLFSRRVCLDMDGAWKPLKDPDLMSQGESVYTGAIYAVNGKQYWMVSNEENWIPVSENALKRFLSVELKIDKDNMNGRLNFITRAGNVELAASLAGYRKGIYQFDGRRILVTTSPAIIEPEEGDCDTIMDLLDQMLGAEQVRYFYGWLQVAYSGLKSSKFIPGQVLAIVGPPDTYKTFVQEKVITPILGGRIGSPFQFMTGQTHFNSDLFQAEHLMISDEIPSTNQDDRKSFGAAIKKLTFNSEQRMHAKGRDAITLTPFWRISMSLNPEDIEILPPMEDGLSDKMMLFKVSESIDIKTRFDGKREEFLTVIRGELSAFVYYLLNEHRIAPELYSDRTGIKSYFNPELVEKIEGISEEFAFFSLVDRSLIGASQDTFTPGELFTRLTSDPNLKQSVLKIAKTPTEVGILLGKLSHCKGEYKGCVSKGRRSGLRGQMYQINLPRYRDCDHE